MNYSSSKIAVVLSLFLAIAFAEKKINLEDIEQDNLRAESKSGSGNINPQGITSYNVPVNPEKIRENYPQSYQNVEEISSSEPHQQLPNKYNFRPEDYQEHKTMTNNVDYREHPQTIQYANYQQQVETAMPKSLPQAASYEPPQQLFYQPEVTVGNMYQSVQQKSASDKFARNYNRESLYVNIPMAQLLSYYPNIGIESSISKSQAQLAIPIYMPTFNRDPISSNSKTTYQIQPQYTSYSSRYPFSTEAILSTRSPSKLIYPQSLLTISHRLPQDQTHHRQEIIYTQQPDVLTYIPSAISPSQETVSSSHLESNTIGQNYASPSGQYESYTPDDDQSVNNYVKSAGNNPSHSTDQVYQQNGVDNIRQDHENIPETPRSEFDLPRVPAGEFKPPTAIQLSQNPKGKDNTYYTHNYLVQSTEPKSLLESYIPSYLLAAQNSEKYRERPLRLEGGFLPSNINFVHSYEKRKIE